MIGGVPVTGTVLGVRVGVMLGGMDVLVAVTGAAVLVAVATAPGVDVGGVTTGPA